MPISTRHFACTYIRMGIKRPPRLFDFDYRGFYRYFLTICTAARRPTFADVHVGQVTAAHFLQSAEAAGFAVIAHCLMTDHLHALLAGTREDADFRLFVRVWKQKTSYDWKRRNGVELWQEGYYERVLRPEESDLLVVAYIAANPVRAGLADSPERYPLFGSSRYSTEEILEALKTLESIGWEP